VPVPLERFELLESIGGQLLIILINRHRDANNQQQSHGQ